MSHASRQINKEIYQIKKELRNIQLHNQHMRLAACKLDVFQNKKAKCALFLTSLSIFLWPLKKVALNAMTFIHGNVAVTAAATATAGTATAGTIATVAVISSSNPSPVDMNKEITKPTVVVEKQIDIPEPIKPQIPANNFTPKTATIIKLDGEQIIGLINHYTTEYVTIETKSGLLTIEQKDIFKIMW